MKSKQIKQWFLDCRDELGEEQTKQLAVWFATRCAMRVAPIGWTNKTSDRLTISILWATAVSWVVGNRPTHDTAAADAAYAAADAYAAYAVDVADAAFAAAAYAAAAGAAAYAVARSAAYAVARSAAYAVARSAASAAAAAARSAYAAADADAAARSADAAAAAEKDLAWLGENKHQPVPASLPLWHNEGPPAELAKIWASVKREWQETPNNPYHFFIDHYERVLRGDEVNWPILSALAGKDAIEIWKTNDIQKIAAYIDGIRSKLIASKTPIAAEVRINQKTKQFEEIDDVSSEKSVVQYAADDIHEALQSIDDIPRNESERLYPVRKKLERALAPSPLKPNVLFSNSFRALKQIEIIWEAEQLGDPYKDIHIGALVSHLKGAVTRLLTDPNIKEMVVQDFDQALMNEQGIQDLILEAATKLRGASDKSLNEAIETDTKAYSNQDNDISYRGDAFYYLIARISRAANIASSAKEIVVTYRDTVMPFIEFIQSESGRLLWDVIMKLLGA